MEIEQPDLQFSLPVSWHILKYISNNGDKKRLRQVCRSWRAAIDQLIGLGLKLTPQNKAKIFDSHIIRQCTSIKIQGGSGSLAWHTCPFHTTKLRKVAIHGEIAVANWRLLMEKCQCIEKITIEIQKEPKAGLNNILAWNSWSRRPQFRIDLDCLTRMFFKGAFASLDFQCDAIINILKTINIPNLRQLVLINNYNWKPSINRHSELKDLRTTIRDMKENCVLFKSFGLVDWHSKYSKMDYWDTLWLSDKDALIIHNCYMGWQKIIQLFHKNTNLDEVHYDLLEHYSIHHNNYYKRFGDKCIENTGRYSKNIRALSLCPMAGLSSRLGEYSATIKCNSLRLLEKLKTLEIKQRVCERGALYRRITLQKLKFPPLLEKVSLWSVLVTNKILRTILRQCLQIQEICIRDQPPQFDEVELTGPNIEKALDHPTLKILVLDRSCERRVRQLLSTLNENLLEDEWLILRQKNTQPKEIEVCTFRYLPNEYQQHLLNHIIPHRMQGVIQLSSPNKKAMALVNLNNVTEDQLLEFEIGIQKDYNYYS